MPRPLLSGSLKPGGRKARGVVVIELGFLRQSFPHTVVFAVGALLLQPPSASEPLRHLARITIGQTLIDLLHPLVIATKALQGRGQALHFLIELFTPEFAHQPQDRCYLRLARCKLFDLPSPIEQFQSLSQARPQLTEIVIPPDLLFSLSFGRLIGRAPLVDHFL